MFFKPTRSPALSLAAPAMVLVEALVACAIIAAVAGLFLTVLADAGANIARARSHAREVMVGVEALDVYRALGQTAPRSGVTAEHRWTLACVPSPAFFSRRLELVDCQVRVRRSENPASPVDVTLATAIAAPRQASGQP
jgi:hypothetical protein